MLIAGIILIVFSLVWLIIGINLLVQSSRPNGMPLLFRAMAQQGQKRVGTVMLVVGIVLVLGGIGLTIGGAV